MDYRMGSRNIINIQRQPVLPIVVDDLTDQLVTVKVKEARKITGRASAD
jgi:hypothetical protein